MIALAREFSKAVLPLLSSERIKPVVDRTFHFSKAAEAHQGIATMHTSKMVLNRRLSRAPFRVVT